MTTSQPSRSRSFRSTLASIAEAIGGAAACAAAAEGGRTPSRQALEAIGIDAETWARIGKL